jgi:tripartite-type tricarboxylate transporter receptor subunit TctC
MKASRIIVAALLTFAATSSQSQEAFNFPQRPVRIIVNVAPGGGVDAAARLVAQKLGERLGQPFVVENRGGGAGNIAAEGVYHSEPDGYTLLASPGATVSVNDFLFKNLNYDPRGFEPVSVLTQVPLALVVRPNFPASSFKDFLDYVKAHPGRLNYASNGIGTAAHLTGELFKMTTGAQMTHVPYKGTSPVLNDLIAGHVDLTFIQYSAFYDLHKAGRAKILAIAAKSRVEPLPDIPTMSEMGFPDIIANTWNMISAPPRTPPAVLTRLNRLINEILSEREVKARFAEMQTAVEGGNLEETRRYVAADREHWKKVIVSAGVQPE